MQLHYLSVAVDGGPAPFDDVVVCRRRLKRMSAYHFRSSSVERPLEPFCSDRLRLFTSSR